MDLFVFLLCSDICNFLSYMCPISILCFPIFSWVSYMSPIFVLYLILFVFCLLRSGLYNFFPCFRFQTSELKSQSLTHTDHLPSVRGGQKKLRVSKKSTLETRIQHFRPTNWSLRQSLRIYSDSEVYRSSWRSKYLNIYCLTSLLLIGSLGQSLEPINTQETINQQTILYRVRFS